MNIQVRTKTIVSIHDELLVQFCYSDKQKLHKALQELSPLNIQALKHLDDNDFSGKESSSLLLFTGNRSLSRLLLVGLGNAENLTLEKIRRAFALAAKKLQALTLASGSLLLSSFVNEKLFSDYDTAVAATEAIKLSLYKFDKYITKEKKDSPISQITFVHKNIISQPFQNGIRDGIILADASIHARNLCNAPGNEIYPETLAKNAQALGRQLKFSVMVFGRQKIQQLGMGGIIGVSKGSEKEPRFIILEYGKKFQKKGTVALVGKGVTFDTGGISIKPAASMAEMKMDMSGAAAVIGTFHAAAKLKLQKHLIGLIPSVENMPSGTAVKPGDIIRHYNGKTSEVDNTDAEGRLILADALSYAEKFHPELVIDLATLTGAVVVALGHYATGMMGNDDATMSALKIAGEKTYERVWQLPLFDEYEKLIKSDVADVKNTGGRWGGAITAGWFLKKFIGKYKWVHLDIAGTAILESDQEYTPRGGSGVGVRLLAEFLKNWK
ncbi:MAG: leucyl aminopeptidase [Bacteroidetes bacterium]|nr:leucyl aminopeptidase [Bacteroidota bacterium]